MSHDMITGTLSSCKTDSRIGCEGFIQKAKIHKTNVSCLKRILPQFQKVQRIFADNSKEFINVCQDLRWTHDTNTSHISEINGIAEKAVRRVEEETARAMVNRGLLNERWDQAVKCYHHLRNVHDKMVNNKTAFGNNYCVQFDGPLTQLRAKDICKSISSQDEADVHLKRFNHKRSRTRRNPVVPMCRRNSLFDLPPPPRGEMPVGRNPEQDEKEEEDTLFGEADGKVFWSGGSIWRRHEVHR